VPQLWRYRGEQFCWQGKNVRSQVIPVVVAVHELVHVFENGIPFSTPVQSLEQIWLSC